jgi:hypothetical protein
MVKFNGRIEDVLQSHRFQSGEDLEQTIPSYVTLYNEQLLQPALTARTPLQAMTDRHKLRTELFRKQPYDLTGCDTHLNTASTAANLPKSAPQSSQNTMINFWRAEIGPTKTT